MGEGGGGKKKKRKLTCVRNLIQTIRKNKTKIITTLERNGSRRAILNTDEVLLKWLKQDRNDKVPVSGPLSILIFVLPKFYI